MEIRKGKVKSVPISKPLEIGMLVYYPNHNEHYFVIDHNRTDLRVTVSKSKRLGNTMQLLFFKEQLKTLVVEYVGGSIEHGNITTDDMVVKQVPLDTFQWGYMILNKRIDDNEVVDCILLSTGEAQIIIKTDKKSWTEEEVIDILADFHYDHVNTQTAYIKGWFDKYKQSKK